MKIMKKNRIVSFMVISMLLVFCCVLATKQIQNIDSGYENNLQHKVEMEKGADPSLGIKKFSDNDYTVSQDFVSHLPLVIIDLDGQKIPEAYEYIEDLERVVKKEDIDPYVNANLSVIDNENDINMLSDTPAEESGMQIKYRGNTSIGYLKHQYRIKLIDEDGNNNPQDIMGMGSDSDWVLNTSLADSSLIRNYMVYDICGQFRPYVPDVKYCEVIMKDGDTYTYQGLYLMMENIKQGTDRVDISDYNPKQDYVSYMVRRDRHDEEEIELNTYATENQLSYGYLSLRYPKSEDATEDVINNVTNDISEIEKVLYSEDEDTFRKYSNYIDVDSFVDYFIINEFFCNYDAGNNSTYMYKDVRGKLEIGPLWDYDNALDNNLKSFMVDPATISFQSQTWFAQLAQSEAFNKKLIKRYRELRQTYFSNDYMEQYIDSLTEYLGNAQKRDWSRWKNQNTSKRFELLEDSDGITIDRNSNTYKEEIQRVKDNIEVHAEYIMPELEKLLQDSKYKKVDIVYTGYGVLVILAFIITVVFVRRNIR